MIRRLILGARRFSNGFLFVRSSSFRFQRSSRPCGVSGGFSSGSGLSKSGSGGASSNACSTSTGRASEPGGGGADGKPSGEMRCDRARRILTAATNVASSSGWTVSLARSTTEEKGRAGWDVTHVVSTSTSSRRSTRLRSVSPRCFKRVPAKCQARLRRELPQDYPGTSPDFHAVLLWLRILRPDSRHRKLGELPIPKFIEPVEGWRNGRRAVSSVIPLVRILTPPADN